MRVSSESQATATEGAKGSNRSPAEYCHLSRSVPATRSQTRISPGPSLPRPSWTEASCFPLGLTTREGRLSGAHSNFSTSFPVATSQTLTCFSKTWRVTSLPPGKSENLTTLSRLGATTLLPSGIQPASPTLPACDFREYAALAVAVSNTSTVRHSGCQRNA